MSVSESLSSLTAEAENMLARGNVEDALAKFQRILDLDNCNVPALNALGMYFISSRNHQRGFAYLELALAVSPENRVTLFNLGLGRLDTKEYPVALSYFNRVIGEKPDHYLARLHAANCAEKMGNMDVALANYYKSIIDAQGKGKWLNDATTGPNMREMVRHAMRYVEDGRERMLSRALTTLRQKHGSDELARVDKCIKYYLSNETFVGEDSRQQPTFLKFPGLNPTPYIKRELTPWIKQLEDVTEAITGDLYKLVQSKNKRERVFLDKDAEKAFYSSKSQDIQWEAYYFYRHGEKRDSNLAVCPNVAAALEFLPLPKISGHAPEVMFSVLGPKSYLHAHRGVTNTRVVVHLPLVIPNDCGLKVAGDPHIWKKGVARVFDDTYLHEAWNNSEQTRVNLIADVWNPNLSLIERDAISLIVGALADLNQSAKNALLVNV